MNAEYASHRQNLFLRTREPCPARALDRTRTRVTRRRELSIAPVNTFQWSNARVHTRSATNALQRARDARMQVPHNVSIGVPTAIVANARRAIRSSSSIRRRGVPTTTHMRASTVIHKVVTSRRNTSGRSNAEYATLGQPGARKNFHRILVGDRRTIVGEYAILSLTAAAFMSARLYIQHQNQNQTIYTPFAMRRRATLTLMS